jgi:glutaredoxin
MPKYTPENCPHCEYDKRWLGYGGWIYHGNNGPIIPCGLCNANGLFSREQGERESEGNEMSTQGD